jgi:hypothetical protein
MTALQAAITAYTVCLCACVFFVRVKDRSGL